MEFSKKRVGAILTLPGEKRYEHFVKQIADSELVWGLFEDGWAIASDGEKESVPLWCAAEYAELARTDDWKSYQATSINLETFLESMLPKMSESALEIAVMYLPTDRGGVVSADRLRLDLENELENY